jgi:hypothetical protein
MSKIVNLPIAKVKDIPEHLRSFLNLQEDGNLPVIPIATRQQIQEQATKALMRFLTVPGLVTKPLTESEKKMIGAGEVLAYNLALKVQDIDCDFNVVNKVLDLMIGPPTQKSERVEVTGTIKEWENRLTGIVNEMGPKFEEAILIEKEKHERANTA